VEEAPPARPAAAPGLYLHLPFCARICPYCDFAVLTGAAAQRQRFVAQLIDEVRLVGTAEVSGPWQGIDTIYLGGGTPSLLEPEQLAAILAATRQALPLGPTPWLTCEANPEDVTSERLTAWRELGVQTLSLGIQSFDDRTLAFLGRRHSGAQARSAAALALAEGVPIVSIDLIYGLPDDTRERWESDLAAAVALVPQHVSCYQLTVHEKTVFGVRAARGDLVELANAAQADLFVFTHHYLGDHGLPAYEVSNFARSPGEQSRHNRKYWQHVPYLGLGPSAHSFDGERRWWNERGAGSYGQRLARGERPIAGEETLSEEQLALESVMLGLRTTSGIGVADFNERFGIDLVAQNAAVLDELTGAGLLAPERDTLRLTITGLAIADAVAAELELGARLPGQLPRSPLLP
jgi:putative oxygen-independent coproporphyrinogen III oxidase